MGLAGLALLEGAGVLPADPSLDRDPRRLLVLVINVQRQEWEGDEHSRELNTVCQTLFI